jgi:hypothetical protein
LTCTLPEELLPPSVDAANSPTTATSSATPPTDATSLAALLAYESSGGDASGG